VILLVDMDAFFASVEQLHHPALRGKPVVVCGDPGRRGVVTAASYEARPFGVRAGMPLAEARRLCPEAHYVEGSPEKYVALSLQLLDLYLAFTPQVEPFSVDEAFLAVGGAGMGLREGAEVAAAIQREVEDRLGLGATLGVGPNKLIAKMASGVRKPRGLTALDVRGFRACFWPRAVRELWGVGPRLAERMRSLGITTIGELAHAPSHLLQGAFGVIGPQLREAASGHDETPLVPYHQGVDPKSMGHEVTLPEDTESPRVLEGLLLRLSDQVARRLRSEGFAGRTVCLKLRDRRFVTRLRQTSLGEHTAATETIFATARGLLQEVWKGGAIRLVGVSVSGLEPADRPRQQELFAGQARRAALEAAVDRLRDRRGESSLFPAGTLSSRSRLAHVPFGALSAAARGPAGVPDSASLP
jgi:DNA polymerase-4